MTRLNFSPGSRHCLNRSHRPERGAVAGIIRAGNKRKKEKNQRRLHRPIQKLPVAGVDYLGDHLVAEIQSLVDVLQGGNAVSFANLNWCIAAIFLFANLNW